jgi:hypothetical protein
MRKYRIVAKPDANDPVGDLCRLSKIRRDLYAHSPVEVDPDSPAHATQRDQQKRAYFEFATDFPGEVERVLRDYGHHPFIDLEEVAGAAGEPCLNCGYTPVGSLPTVCPNCRFRDISACPHCQEEIPRHDYERVAGDLFRCPRCRTYVRLRLNEPLRTTTGDYQQPMVLVEEATEAPV